MVCRSELSDPLPVALKFSVLGPVQERRETRQRSLSKDVFIGEKLEIQRKFNRKKERSKGYFSDG
jgi:hypothetical protein